MIVGSRAAGGMSRPVPGEDMEQRNPGGPRYENGRVDGGLPDRSLGERGCASVGCETQAAKRSSGFPEGNT